MIRKSMGEVVMSLLFTLVGAAGIVIIQMQKFDALSNTGTTDFRTMPTFAGAMLAFLSLVNAGRFFVREYRRKRAAGQLATGGEPEKSMRGENGNTPGARQEENGARERHGRLTQVRVILMFLLCLAVALLMKAAPFFILIFGFLFLSFLVLGQKRIWVNGLVSLLGSGLIYLIFIVLLKLPL